MFGSALSYIALRLLGEGPEDGENTAIPRGRKWILDHGGLVAIPSWGKFWASVRHRHKYHTCVIRAYVILNSTHTHCFI